VSVPIRPRGFGLVVTLVSAGACLIVPLAAWWIWRRRRVRRRIGGAVPV
jgi:hypothetical protein